MTEHSRVTRPSSPDAPGRLRTSFLLALTLCAGCGSLLKESSEPSATEQELEEWKSKPPVTPIWNPGVSRVLLKVDGAADAKPFDETIRGLTELLQRILSPSVTVGVVTGEPLTPDRLAPYVRRLKLYQDPLNAMTVRIPEDVTDDRKYLEELFEKTLSGARKKRPNSETWEAFEPEDARELAAQLVFEGATEALDYERLLDDLRPEHVPEHTYLIHVWSDGLSNDCGGGSSSWSHQTRAVLRLERKVIESRAILHITTRAMERVTALHELGHILGLVSHPTHHRAGHCTNPACIMYPGTVNARTILANLFTGLVGRPKSSFCGECEEDLEAFGQAARSSRP
jgi:hypothetical protein